MGRAAGSLFRRSISISEDANVRGFLYYSYLRIEELEPDDSFYVKVTTGNKNTFLMNVEYTITTDRMDAYTYVDPDITGGTPLEVFSYNMVTPQLPASTTIDMSPSVNSKGILIDENMIVGQPDSNKKKVAGDDKSTDIPRIIPANTELLLEYKNTGKIDMDGLIRYVFFERDIDIPVD